LRVVFARSAGRSARQPAALVLAVGRRFAASSRSRNLSGVLVAGCCPGGCAAWVWRAPAPSVWHLFYGAPARAPAAGRERDRQDQARRDVAQRWNSMGPRGGAAHHARRRPELGRPDAPLGQLSSAAPGGLHSANARRGFAPCRASASATRIFRGPQREVIEAVLAGRECC